MKKYIPHTFYGIIIIYLVYSIIYDFSMLNIYRITDGEIHIWSLHYNYIESYKIEMFSMFVQWLSLSSISMLLVYIGLNRINKLSILRNLFVAIGNITLIGYLYFNINLYKGYGGSICSLGNPSQCPQTPSESVELLGAFSVYLMIGIIPRRKNII